MHRVTRRKTKVRRAHRPCQNGDNFYGLVNSDWVAATDIPPTETRITQAYFIREQINRELHDIIGKSRGPVTDLRASITTAERQQIPHGIAPVIHALMTISSPSDVAERIGWMNRFGMNPPLALSVQGDPRDNSKCRIFIEEGQPRIGIPEYWTWPSYRRHRIAYGQYVQRLAAILHLPALLKGYEAERSFAKVFPSANDRKRRIDMMTWSELQREFPRVDWTRMLVAWGLPRDVLATCQYNVTSRPFVHHTQQRLQSWSPERWSGWFGLLAAQWLAGIMPPSPLRSAWFAYSRRFLQDMKADEPPPVIYDAIVTTMMPNTIGKAWAEKHCSPALKRDVSQIVEHIRAAADHALQNTSWMSKSTRTAAVRKLRKMDIQVCYPDLDKWPTQEACGITRTDYVGNLMAIMSLSTDKSIEQIAKGNCRHPTGYAWGRPVFEVNAFYYPNENRFLLPAAILRPPFYDPAKSIPWNYGAIGATIGHELCHAFDAEGREYDENGDKRVWWTDHDDREYRRRANAVVKLFESTQYRRMDVDGELTLIENIADLGGLEFALAGARLALGRKLTQSELQEFFRSFAVSWRSKDRLKRAAELLATDFHAPPMLRVNHIVRQMDEWYEAFDINPDCHGYIDPTHRIHFFA